ncbi:YDG domain-containing protein [Pseudoxanthomonas sp. X-1]|uniref:YDG domain-containing protein n=2 Tax=Pseudoxanthomonas sp. X-1 TaxID=2571115 RepID=UPI001CC6D160|nr:YDG domain-containing protein [Pseudoxanthomonas sp. X-1]UAY74303.1 filamentous hemagglutinin N-terminal domain-containing protein [Pseudoxanthomonas sp. X-1]
MNHIYRLIWDELRGAYVVAAEISRRRGKRSGTVVRAAAAAIAIGSVPLSAYAVDPGTLPSGAQIAAGNAQLGQQGAHLTVHQDSQRLILNWNSFDIGDQASVRFEQPNSSAIALNRVLGGTTSQVLGELSGNGQVWLVNPNGVYFGKGAQVDVGGLLVSSLGISDSDFLAGRARFAATGAAGAVRNEGAIRANGGVVALLAPAVSNTGSITAGQVGLAAGDRVALDFDSDGLLSLAVEQDALKAELTQSGVIRGNNVVLSAAGASALRSSVINMDGVVEATSLGVHGGRILLDGGDAGQVHVSGRLDASSATGQGGRIDVLGQQLRLDGGARLDASGATGGGAIHVGGGWQGHDASLRNATRVDADASVALDASAVSSGNGGEAVVWSDGDTRFAGSIAVRGGAQGGDGGRAEVSGKQDLAYSGRTDASAAHGAMGDLLLDPSTISIQAGGTGSGSIGGTTVYVQDLQAQNANVMLVADNGITFGDLSLNGGNGRLSMANNVSLRLENTSGTISFANPTNTVEVFGTGSLYFQSGRTGTGYLRSIGNLIAHGAGTNPATLPTHDVTQNGNGTPGAGSITLYGADGITVSGAVTTNGGYVRIWGDSDNAGGGDLTLSSPINTSGGNVYLSTGSGAVTLNSSMTLGAGRVTFRADGSYTTGEKILNGLIDASGDFDIDTPFTMKGGASIYTSGNINFGNVAVNLDTGGGVLVLRANKIDWGSSTLNNLSTASMRLEPYDPTVNMVLGDANGFASAATLNKLPGIRNLTIGRADGTGTISVSGNYNFNASGSFELLDKTLDITAGSLSNSTGNVILTGDNINLSQQVTANGGNGKVTIRQMTAANALHLGTGLSNASIGQVNAATLEMGRSDGGDLVFDSDIVTGASTVSLKSGQRVLGINGGVSAAKLAVTAGAGATLTDSTFDFTTLALDVGGASQVTSSSANWSLGAADTLTGLNVRAGTTGTVGLTATGTLGLNSAVNFNNSAAALAATAGTAFNASSTTLSNQAAATVAFALAGGNPFAFGGTSTTLSSTALSRFNGVNTLRVDATGNDVTMGAFNVTVGNRVQVQARRLQQTAGVGVAGGSLYLSAAQDGLALNQAISAAQTLSLNDIAGAGIQGSGALTAAALAVRSSGAVTLNSTNNQVNTIAAQTGDLSFRNNGSLRVGSADGLAGIASTGAVDVRLTGASADLTLQQAVSAGNGAQQQTGVLLAAGRNFINQAGSNAVSTGNGRWLVYSASPLDDTRGGLAPEFKQYNADTGTTVLDAGSGFLYRVAPTVGVALTGAASKTYDGNATASLGGIGYTVSSGAIDGDTVVVSGTAASYDSKNAGNGKAVTVTGLSIDQASNGAVRVYGYDVASTSASANIGTINQKTIQLGAGSVQDKVYDGTTTASLGTATLSGVIGGDDVAFAGASGASFVDKRAGTGKQVTVSGITLGGNDAGNYLVDSTAYADIAKRTLTVAVDVAGKVYDGGTGAQVNNVTLGNAVFGDDVSVATQAAFVDKNVGDNKAVVVNAQLGGNDADNYVMDAGTSTPRVSTASITPKTIDAGTLSVTTKVYDGNRTANVGSTGLVGTVSGDDVALTLQGQYDNKNVGTGKQVDVTAGLLGGDAGNYRLTNTSLQSSGDITPKSIDAGTLSVTTKVYDGNRTANVGSSGLVGTVNGDDVALTLQGQYDNKNADTGKQVDVTAGLLGGDAGNYRLTNTSLQSSGDITPKSIDAGTLSVTTKVYDGNRTANVGSSGLVGTVNGDDVALTLQGQYDNKNAGTGKQVDVTAGLLGGDAGNYRLTNTSLQSSGDITPKSIDAGTLSVTTKVYDGNRTANVGSSGLVGTVNGDDVALTLQGQYDNKNVGTGKQVDVTAGLLGGDAGNYRLTNTSLQSSGDITPKSIDAGTLSVTTKVYDGNRTANVGSSGLVGTVSGDDVALTLQGQYDNKNAGTGKQVDVTAGLLGGDAGNYRLTNTSLQSSGDITPKSIDAGTLSVTTKVYDGNRTANVGSTGLVGTVSGDDVALTLQGQYDNKNAGTDKRVDISAGLRGDDAGNYRLVNTSLQSRGDVTAKQLTVGSVAVLDKPFDGSSTAVLVLPPLRGVVSGDEVVLQGQGQYDDASTALGKTVQVSLTLNGADAGNYRLTDALQQTIAGIAELPGRNAVDAISQSTLGGNGTRPGGTNDGGPLTSAGAIAAATGAMGDLGASAQPQLVGTSLDPTGIGASGGAGGTGNVGNAAGSGAGNGAGNGGGARTADGGASTGIANAVRGGAADANAGAGTASTAGDGGRGGASGDVAMGQVLRNGTGVSLATGGQSLAQPEVTVLPVFDGEGHALGRLRVEDLGGSLVLHPLDGESPTAPDLQQSVRARAQTRVAIDADETATLRLSLLQDGTLHVVAPRSAARLDREVLSAYALDALKQQAGVSVRQVRALVLSLVD